jgi:NAD(P)-dependent dehydrogenase (short-subunit alcohol dehydrogenase family)
MDRTVLVTGCSTGIGAATARAFLDAGWTVYATGRDPDDLTGLADAGARTLALDVTSAAAAERAVEHVDEEEGGIDCLVNNAGYGQLGPVEDVPVDRVRDQYDVNVFGPLRLLRAALPRMRGAGGGTVVNVTSLESRFPFAGTGVYASTKSALTTLTQAARQEVADAGVDVVAVEPAFVATPFYERALAELEGLDRSPAHADLYEVLESARAVERGGPGVAAPEDVADAVLAAAEETDPDPRYEVGGLAAFGRVVDAVLPATLKPSAMRLGVRAVTSAPVRGVLGVLDGRSEGTGRAGPPGEETREEAVSAGSARPDRE